MSPVTVYTRLGAYFGRGQGTYCYPFQNLYLHIFLQSICRLDLMNACFSAYSMIQLCAERLVLYEKIRLLFFE